MTLRRCLILALFVCGCGSSQKGGAVSKPVNSGLGRQSGEHGADSKPTSADLPAIVQSAAERNKLETQTCPPLCLCKGSGTNETLIESCPQVPAKSAK